MITHDHQCPFMGMIQGVIQGTALFTNILEGSR